MQIEVGFDPCQMTHVDLRQCLEPGVGALYIAVSAAVLLGLMPRALRPFLILIGDSEAEEVVCAPEERELLILALVGAVSSFALLWWFTPLSTEPAMWNRFEPLGQGSADALFFTAFCTGWAMLLSLGQRTADRALGRGMGALVGSATLLSVLAVAMFDDGFVSLALWIPIFLVLAGLVRDAKRVAWKTTRVTGLVSAAILGVRALMDIARAFS